MVVPASRRWISLATAGVLQSKFVFDFDNGIEVELLPRSFDPPERELTASFPLSERAGGSAAGTTSPMEWSGRAQFLGLAVTCTIGS